MSLKKLVPAGWKKREEEREKKRAFLKNGGLVLEKLVESCNGRPIPIRTFSYQELILATNSFDPRLILDERGWCTSYKGSFEGRILSINMSAIYPFAMDLALTDMAISAQMSAHKNILKLVGCCLETSTPSSLYEYAQNGVLADRIDISGQQGTLLVWQSRLKIARQIAHTIAYLHTAFSRPIIHRDIKLQNIFLDQHDVPKLCDFSLSISIPEGETHVKVDRLMETHRFMCPIYAYTGMITEKTDVFSFGVVLLELLTGQRAVGKSRDDNEEDRILQYYIRNRAINEIVDPAILAEEGGAGVEQQLQAMLQLALICIENDPEIRPTMVDVTKELRRIERSIA